ncbi:DUF3806 domain-containing protein [Zavarzinella formosa]|uniref:DUF3806 domain-containing protein n=1 Tax=Zavarzinella formosa TaxID=360055 RepID=UPI000305A378|nr:DUF3806 domain-containing protein [Zavarzinella formosa]
MAKRKSKPEAPAASEGRDYSRPASVIFYNADLGMVSPAVSDYWPRPIQELIRDSEAMLTTNFPGASCARFIGWYLARPGTGDSHLGVDNLPVTVRNYDGDEAGPSSDWLDRLLAEVNRWNPDAVLVRLDGLTITQGGRLLWRVDWVQRPTGQKFSLPSRRRQAWITRQLAAARRLVATLSPADADGPMTLDALDRVWAAWRPQTGARTATTETDPAAVLAVINSVAEEMWAAIDAVGTQFGQFLTEQAGFEWIVADDASGTELIVRALAGRGDVLVYPVKFVEMRWFQPEASFLAASFEAIREDVEAVAAGRPVTHWPW